jgi:hypothetical protein
MATEHDTSPTPFAVTPRGLVIPHVLTPEEAAGLLRIGEALADIQERLAAVMGRPGGPIASELQDLALLTIDLLDVVELDPDAEPDGGEEPSLGWTVDGRTGSGNDLHDLDCEHDTSDLELFGDEGDPWNVPLRLDVYAEPMFFSECLAHD